MSTIYLAGPIAGRSYAEANEWRERVGRDLWAAYHIRCLSPLRDIEPLGDDLTAPVAARYEQTVLSSSRAIVARDRNDIARADVVLVNLLGAQRVSIGTMIELGWADALRIPIVLIMEPGNPHEHEMIRELAPFVVSSLREGIEVVKSILGV